MKTTQKFGLPIAVIAWAFITLFTGLQCKKEQTEIEKLPAATQTGANTFGCLIDGKAFTPKRKSVFEGSNLQCQYQYLEQNNVPACNYFALDASDSKSYSDGIHIVSITAKCMDLEEKIYSLEEHETLYNLSAGFVILYNGELKEYYTNSIVKGELSITHFDLQNQIVAGTFWFDAVNPDGQKVEVREGRFDVQFIR